MIPVQVAQACSAFIVGKELTTDGSMLFGRTEDYPYAPDGGRHNKTYEVVPAKDYKDGDMLEDESNGFAYPHLSHEMKYTATYDAAHGDGSNGNFGAHGFNEAGVSMTSTVSATPHDKILKADPLVKMAWLKLLWWTWFFHVSKQLVKELSWLPRYLMKKDLPKETSLS